MISETALIGAEENPADYKIARIFETPMGQVVMLKAYDAEVGYGLDLKFRLSGGLIASATYYWADDEEGCKARDKAFDDADMFHVMERIDPVRVSLEKQMVAGNG